MALRPFLSQAFDAPGDVPQADAPRDLRRRGGGERHHVSVHLAPRGMEHPLRAVSDPVAVERDLAAHRVSSRAFALLVSSIFSSFILTQVGVPPAGVRLLSSHSFRRRSSVSWSHWPSQGALIACATRLTRRRSASCVFISPSLGAVFSSLPQFPPHNG